MAGEIEAVGDEVTAFRPGDEVFGVGNGTFAEYATALPDKIAPKPPNVGFEEAATVPTTGCTALQGVRDVGKVQSGQRVLVIGKELSEPTAPGDSGWGAPLVFRATMESEAAEVGRTDHGASGCRIGSETTTSSSSRRADPAR